MDSHYPLLTPANNLLESLTIYLYWSILECGLALLAACLPPTTYLFTHLLIPSVSNNVRSYLSIKKVRPARHTPELSRGLNTKHNQWALYGEGDQNSDASHAAIFQSRHLKYEQLYTEDLEIGSLRDDIVLGPMVGS